MFAAAQLLAGPLSRMFVGYDQELLTMTLRGFCRAIEFRFRKPQQAGVRPGEIEQRENAAHTLADGGSRGRALQPPAEDDEANELFSMLVYVSAACGIVLTAAGLLCLRPLLSMLGAGGQMLEDCITYGKPPVPNRKPTQPKMISTGIMKLTAVKAVFPTKFDTKKPSTTP